MDTWWIDEPLLLGSRNPSDSDLERLRRDGFAVVVSLLCEKERALRYDIARAAALGYVRHNIPVRDFSAPTVEQLEQFVKLVDSLPAETKMIVHCEGGTGRTGTFAAAYWVTKGMMAADAILHVRNVRWRAVETPEPVRPARCNAENNFAFAGRRNDWLPARGFHHGPELAPLKRPKIRVQSDLITPPTSSLAAEIGIGNF